MSVLKLVSPVSAAFVSTPVTVADRLASANISLTGSTFNRYFRSMKLGTDILKKDLVFHDLTQFATNKQIRKELSANHIITIKQFLDLIEVQRDGHQGQLLVNGMANIAYIEDETGTVWSVRARFLARGGDWYVEAFSVAYPHVLFAGRRVVSGK